ncbi:hypothetical protein CONCODRAFT_12916 [Conidiobolus coronatus NRRL 28638]|uniref:Uncharacterized protein n=1 Tax=Conidiobolus coronatus (strain ATCC 28846 / CBS 209.66 / NRRL 28638) TaxID=796925 RepID=A0A137NRU0_CONC2|nr:hypothetical protein CONCODRAFT_12916 [Conidiobolus coronatus NRRL 28638]|eukprot:KXN65479.1 hypothetical protein CONCODRAFT_12916 [Conidiobolus coronatus NRRL 28638]
MKCLISLYSSLSYLLLLKSNLTSLLPNALSLTKIIMVSYDHSTKSLKFLTRTSSTLKLVALFVFTSTPKPTADYKLRFIGEEGHHNKCHCEELAPGSSITHRGEDSVHIDYKHDTECTGKGLFHLI